MYSHQFLMNRKIRYTLLISFVLCIAAIIFLMRGCRTTQVTFGQVGKPAISSNGNTIALLIAESHGTSTQENGGYRSTRYSTDYWLKLYETGSGKLIKKKKIITAAEKTNMLVLCYGSYADKIWLNTDGLAAYDISSLEEVLNQEKLAVKNNFDADQFPDDQRFVDELLHEGFIRFMATNRERYLINLSSLEINNEKTFPETFVKKIKEQLHTQITNPNSYTTRMDTSGSKIYILAKDSVSAMNSYPGNYDADPVYKPMYLYSANFTVDHYSNHRFYRYKNMSRTNGPDYLNARFIKDVAANKVLQKTGIYLVMHNDSLSNNARIMLTAIDKSNQIRWQTNTGLSSKISHCIVKNNYCILTGNKDYLLSSHIGSDMVCMVDMETGKMKKLLIEE